MTKQQFMNYKNEETFCATCNRMLPTKNFMYSYIRLNGTASVCRYCAWIKRHNRIPNISNYDKDIVKNALEFLIFEKSIYVNDLANELNMTLEETIKLVQSLKVGNKTCLVKSNCDYCGKEIENEMSAYMSTNHHYCNYDCYWKHKPETVGHGENNVCYKRIKTQCTNCKKEIDVIPYDYNKTNEFGDHHNFCSQECYWEYRSNYYVGEKSVGFNRTITDEQRERMRLTIIKNSRSSKRFDSKIQLTINDVLDKHNIKYEREYIIKYYAIDNYLTESNLMIEVMGDYWHTSPLKYNEKKYIISELQQNGLKHDKQKHTYIKTHNNVEILYLWEYDIEHNLDMCEALILKYISSNGNLENYHSFNWNYENGILSINNEIIVPYQDMKIDEYRHLIKKKVG